MRSWYILHHGQISTTANTLPLLVSICYPIGYTLVANNYPMNLWHDIPLGDNAPEEFNTIIEIPRGSPNKYEIDKATGLIKLDRVNYSAAPYPFHPGILVSVRPVAVMEMIDDGDSDYKIIAVPVDDKRWDDVKDLKDLNKHALKEYQHFFETY